MSCLARPRRHRLLRRSDFTLCYDAGRRFHSKHFLVFVYSRLSGDTDWRIGMAVTKKTGTAVVRNRVKRVLREFFRLNQELMPPAVDLVIVPKRHLKPELLTLATASRELEPLLQTIRSSVLFSCTQDTEKANNSVPSCAEHPTQPGVLA